MNLNNVSQREVLNFENFLKKVHDNNYKPLSPANQSSGGMEKSGLSAIKREPAYDFVGYADAVFAKTSKIDVPGARMTSTKGKTTGYLDTTDGLGITQLMSATESLDNGGNGKILRLNEFEGY